MDVLISLIVLLSLLLFLIGLISPKVSLFWYEKEKTRKRSALIYGGIFIAAFTVSAILTEKEESRIDVKSRSKKQKDSHTGQAKQEGLGKPEETETHEPEYAKIGDLLSVGNFIYQVNSIKFTKSIGSEYSRTTADGIFLIINMTIKNVGNEPHTLDNSFFRLTDEQGVTYETSSEAEVELMGSGNETLFLKEFNPNIPKKGSLAFEVPEKKVYDLHLTGGFWTGKTTAVKLIN